MNKSLFAAALAGATFLGFGAQAAVIDFDELTGFNGDTYTGHVDDEGFAVTVLTGSWFEAHSFGNPVPSIFSTSDDAAISIMSAGGGVFNAISLDVGDASGGSSSFVDFEIEGFLNGASQFLVSDSQNDTPAAGDEFGTFLTPATAIDALIVRFDGVNTSSYNIDNIVVAPVPVPAAGLLLLTALGGAVALRRKA